MKRKMLLSASVVIVACSSACGSSDTSSKPNNVAVANADVGAVSCVNFHTAYAGDDKCIQPPDASQGYQFHYGPSNYNDPAEVAKYVLKPGDEVTDCLFFKVPNKQTVYFDSYHARMRPGSHHMLLYLQDQQVPTSTAPEPCNQSPNSRVLYGAQTPQIDVNGLTAGAPENQGLAAQIHPGQQAVLQAHFINATGKPILREVWANMVLVDKSQVTQVADFPFFLAGVLMNIPVGSTQVTTGSAVVPPGVPSDFRMVMLTGHYHAHTSKFTAFATINGVRRQLFEEYNTIGVAPDPLNWYFDSGKQNTPPNPATHTGGANHSGILHLKPGDRVDWECTQTNDGKGTNGMAMTSSLTFGNYVYTAEMCNLFGLYAPAFGTTNWTQTNF